MCGRSGDDAFGVALRIERRRRRVGEAAQVGAAHDAEPARFPVERERADELARRLHAARRVEPRRHRQLAVGGEAAGGAEPQIGEDVRTQPAAELRADDPAGVRRQRRLEHRRRIGLGARGQKVQLAVERDLEAGEVAEALLQLERADEARAIEHRRFARRPEPARRRVERFVLVEIVEPVQARLAARRRTCCARSARRRRWC